MTAHVMTSNLHGSVGCDIDALRGSEHAARLDEALGAVNDLAERVRIVRSRIEGRIAFSSSLGLEDQALLHAIAESGANIDVFMLDTGRHFEETYDTVAASEARFGVKIRIVAPDTAALEALTSRDGVLGFRSSIDARKACCDVRKVQPLKRALAGASGWLTGLRRAQSSGRSEVRFAAHDDDALPIKISPLADWSLDRVEDYVALHAIPINALHARGYPSIGCAPCTRAVRPGEEIRAGRWWWENEDGKECGLHAPRR